ncbi:MAG TPA: Rieske 2Fe-2S domain-containing protein, partial [Dehalococcoidia bacterium]|nr:Rieske 2Fe-2S domain-containing protein [Dehalococcoidia bacterium]
MLSAAENQLLTRVGPGTPMGELLRQYWQPFLRSSDLPERDGRPLRIKLLGERLIAFRDSDGGAGLLGENCPHRGASLYFGRNEESGLRCVYHGWKFDTVGRCTDKPNEPPEGRGTACRAPADKVRQTAYPCLERGGVIWAYMGPSAPKVPPPLPDLEWNMVPEDHCYLALRVQECNWTQVMEGEIDSSHAGFLHTRLNEEKDVEVGLQRGGSRGLLYKMRDRHPRFETLDTEYGVAIAARRAAEEDSYYWRITQFLMPFFTLIPPYGNDPVFGGHVWVPIDDELTLSFGFSYHPTKPLPAQERGFGLGFDGRGVEGLHPSPDVFLPPSSEPYGQFRPRINAGNDYSIDWDAQRNERFSGLPGLWPQDAACQESMGRIYDRSQEHLGMSDSGIIRARRRLMLAAKALREQGATPPGVESP